MSGAFRLASGGRIDRTRPLAFTFDGRAYVGATGDTLASALLANGVHLVGRSFKYHRPRGIFSAGSEEPNALVTVGGDGPRRTPNLRATQVELFDGLVAESQNRWPALAFDAGAVVDRLSPLFAAGFYYKTFMWPPAAWHKLYEPLIRHSAGLGRAPATADADRYSRLYAHCEVLVVGAGPAGLAAALAAAATGARVILCDEQAEMGGSLLAETAAVIDGKPASAWVTETLATLARQDNVTLLPRTTAFGWYPHNMIGLAQRVTDHLAAPDADLPRERLWQVRAKEVVLATGAIERPLAFPDNDRPGIMLADAARTYVTRYGVRPGGRAVVFTAGDGGYRAALALKAAGVEIAAIADLRLYHDDSELPDRARAAGIPLRQSTTVTGTRGRLRVSAADLAAVAADGRVGPSERVACDLVLMSGGFTPTVHLFSQSRGRLRWDEKLEAFVPGASVAHERSAGGCRGNFALHAAIKDGFAAGAAAAEAAGCGGARRRTPAIIGDDAVAGGFIGATPHNRSRARAFVDFQNDVTTEDLALATREGFRSIEHIKRYTTTGMATDQGKTSNLNALAIVSEAQGAAVPEVGLTTFRPPYTPTTFGTFAGPAHGKLFDPVRTTPIHGWAEGQGAVFEDVGQWKRARYFPTDSEDMHAAVNRECRAVRDSAGLFDASTLGKIEVVGPDAGEFLDRMYVNAFSSLQPGRLRYGIMLREDGFVTDDGVIARVAPDRFHVTTTTGGAARVLHMMEDYLQTEWPQLDCWLTSTTEQWAVIAVQGPQARAVLAPLVTGIDLAAEAMPHMSLREGKICGVPMRLFRVSFTGELGYEVNVPADFGHAIWEAIFAAGRPHGITPYGTETMHVLRAEKGYIIAGQDADGTATPDDLGLGWAVGKKKRDFVGKRSLARQSMAAPDRKQLVGLRTLDPRAVLPEGAQITAEPPASFPAHALGHVTSSYWSAVLDRSIALAMVAGGRKRSGEQLVVPLADRVVPVEVTAPVFYDMPGERLHG
jgi:sarcosine oxidase, subunit alpha